MAAASTEEYSCEFGSTKYFALCALGGVLSCGITHTAITPLDLVKCRLQVDKEKYKSVGTGFKVTMAEGGAAGLYLGWAPTAIGYSAQGLFTKPLSTLPLLPAQNSLQTLLFLPGSAVRSKCKPLQLEPSQEL